jgi:hypothetical protein
VAAAPEKADRASNKEAIWRWYIFMEQVVVEPRCGIDQNGCFDRVPRDATSATEQVPTVGADIGLDDVI